MLHVPVCVPSPQLPHDWLSGSVHLMSHVLGHWQPALQRWVPAWPLLPVQFCESPGLHAPPPLHALHVALPVFVSHVLVCVPKPQLPHARVGGSLHGMTQSAHWQLLLHVCVPVPFAPQLRLLLGVQAPCIEHVLMKLQVAVSVLQVLACVPQLPQGCVGGLPGQTCFMHALGHWQSLPQVRVPCEPHICVSPAAHLPSPLQVLQVARPVLGSQVLVCVPQLPHARVLGSTQLWPVHALAH
jgi:hypothetical protein